MRVSAFKSAISAKIADQEVVVLDELVIKEPKTKLVQEILDNFKVENKNVLFVTPEQDNNIVRAVKNIPNADITYADVLNTYDVVASSKVYITKDAIKKLEEAYK